MREVVVEGCGREEARTGEDSREEKAELVVDGGPETACRLLGIGEA